MVILFFELTTTFWRSGCRSRVQAPPGRGRVTEAPNGMHRTSPVFQTGSKNSSHTAERSAHN